MKKQLLLPFSSTIAAHPRAALLLLLLLVAATAQAQATYYWRGAANANFTGTPDNWCTSPVDPVTAGNRRNSAVTTDILVFSGGSPVVTMNTGQTIGRLKFTSSTSVTLNSASNTTNTVNINGDATDDDLIVETGSAVALTATGTSGNPAGVVLNLGASATGRVAGTITLTNVATNPPSSADKLTSPTDNALRFTAGGQLIILGSIGSTAFSGTPVFEAGSTLEQNAANSSDITGAADYRSGSTFRYIDGTFASAALTTDRTFGNLEYASAAGRTIGGASNLTILNNLTVTGSGTLVISARGDNGNAIGTLIGGNISVTNPAATLFFNPGTAAPNMPRVRLNGTMPQTISGVGVLSFGANAKLEINNPAGVTLQSDLTINNDLILTNGLLTTSTSGSGLLTMTAAAPAVVGGSSASFVNGPVARSSAAGNSTLLFPVGRVATGGNKSYRPITLALSSQGKAVTYTAQQVEAAAAPFGVVAPIDHVSTRRYYTVAASAAPTGPGFSASITLAFGPDDYVNNATTSSLVVAKRNGGAWSSIGTTNTGAGTTSNTPLTGTLTSGPFTSFSDFTLASTAANGVGYPGLNPLPVALIRFEAEATTGTGVNLRWATASEQNSAYFEVQRSATGEAYETLGRVAAQGSSTSLREYAFSDARPLAGRAYYRLRQVDHDGTAAYSPVATATRHRADLAAYPNPTADDVTLPAGLGPVRYRVLNGLGQALASGQATGGDRLDLCALPKGAFFLELTDAAGRRTQRLVRE